MLRVGGEPRKTAPTHPPSAEANFGRAAVRDASAIPPRVVLDRCKGIHCLAFVFFCISLLFSCSPLGRMVVVQTLEGLRLTSRT